MTIFKVIDICGPTPKGTGLQNMREAIIESKWKYDVSTEDKQVCSWIKVGILIELSISSKRLVGRAWSWTSWSGTSTWSALPLTRWSTGRPTTRRASSPGWTTTMSSGNKDHWRSWCLCLLCDLCWNYHTFRLTNCEPGRWSTVGRTSWSGTGLWTQPSSTTSRRWCSRWPADDLDDSHHRPLFNSHHAPLHSGQLQREPGHPYPHHLWLCLCHVRLAYHISFHILWIWFGPR